MPLTTVAARPTPRREVVEEDAPAVALTLLDHFGLRCDGRGVALPASAQRLLAFLALQARPVLRVYVAGVLWIDAPEDRAFASLRSALWRLNKPACRLVDATSGQLRLAPGVRVDFRDATALAQRLLGGSAATDDRDVDWTPLAGELLPGWYDEWVLMERERYRQLGLHALEGLAQRYIDASSPGRALNPALAAVAGEPLRESAHRVLIRVHLAEGNGGEALRQYELCRRLLRDRLGLAPSPQLDALIQPLTRR